MKRILTAVVFLPLFYVLNTKLPPAAFVSFACLCAVIAGWELSRLARARGLVSHWPLNSACANDTRYANIHVFNTVFSF